MPSTASSPPEWDGPAVVRGCGLFWTRSGTGLGEWHRGAGSGRARRVPRSIHARLAHAAPLSGPELRQRVRYVGRLTIAAGAFTLVSMMMGTQLPLPEG